MAKFVVLDPSLTGVGGHHYEHARQLLQAADDLGLQPVLATSVHFAQRDLLPSTWPVLPLFPDESRNVLADYPLDAQGSPLAAAASGASDDPRGDPAPPSRAERWRPWRRVRARWHTRALQGRLERFAAACAELAALARLGPQDQIFLPTASLFDLLGVVRFLQARPQYRTLCWHALFHYGFLSGREADYHRQEAVQRNVHRQLAYILEHFPPQQLRLYGTTHRLAGQFNRLGLTEWNVLPFPVDGRALAPDPHAPLRATLRLTCAGFLRREKGKACAGRFVTALWNEGLLADRIQLVVQTNRRQARRMVPRRAAIPLALYPDLAAAPAAPIIWLEHPLRREAYVELIRASDLAVFLHEDLAYYTRCSGVLVEMLAGGVPVLVPAGTWLADQIAAPIADHVDHLLEHSPILARQTGRLVWDPDGTAAACDSPVPAGARAVVVRLAWRPDAPPGSFVRVSLVPDSEKTTPAALPRPVRSIVAPAPPQQHAATLLPLAGQAPSVRLTLARAYDASRLGLQQVELVFLGAPSGASPTYASGRVGLVYADVDQLPRLIREMCEHYPHYRATARDFAVGWRARHDARRIVAQLVGDDAQVRRAVA